MYNGWNSLAGIGPIVTGTVKLNVPELANWLVVEHTHFPLPEGKGTSMLRTISGLMAVELPLPRPKSKGTRGIEGSIDRPIYLFP